MTASNPMCEHHCAVLTNKCFFWTETSNPMDGYHVPIHIIILDVNSCLTIMPNPTWELFHSVLGGTDDLIVVGSDNGSQYFVGG